MIKRVAIIAQTDPVATAPHLWLYPRPNSVGEHLWQLTAARTGATKDDYARAFHRYILCSGYWFYQGDAEEQWETIEGGLIKNFDRIVLVGTAVRRAAGLLLPDLYISSNICAIPQPHTLQGRQREIVEVLFEELYNEAVYG